MSIDSAAAAGLPARRTFLRQLASLPLLGGAVTLIGQPSAVAEAPAQALLENYNQWLWGEHCRCASELRDRFDCGDVRFKQQRNAGAAFHSLADWNWNPNALPASARAAVVLAAVGCDWRRA